MLAEQVWPVQQAQAPPLSFGEDLTGHLRSFTEIHAVCTALCYKTVPQLSIQSSCPQLCIHFPVLQHRQAEWPEAPKGIHFQSSTLETSPGTLKKVSGVCGSVCGLTKLRQTPDQTFPTQLEEHAFGLTLARECDKVQCPSRFVLKCITRG